MSLLRFFQFALPLLLLAGCASLPYRRVEGALQQGRFDEARATLAQAQADYGERARLLWLFDSVSLNHYAGAWESSNAALEEADRLIDRLYTRSLGNETLAFALNDRSRAYLGENFERVLLHVLGMVNYAALGRRDEALVEARRVDERLKTYAQMVGEDKVGYREDALARYLAAYLYEGGSGQDLWDAYLDYKKADEAFELYAKLYGTPKPRRLKADLQRMAGVLGEQEDLRRWRERDGLLAELPQKKAPREQGEVLVLLYEGLAPFKVSKIVSVPVELEDGTKQYFQLALPEFVSRLGPPPRARLLVDGRSELFELFEDVNAIAVRDLQDRGALVLARATLRALAKFQLARAVQRQARESGGAAELLSQIGTNLFTLLSEQADTRSWRTLPGRIWLARVNVEPGLRTLQIQVEQKGESRLLKLGEHDFAPGARKVLVQTLFDGGG